MIPALSLLLSALLAFPAPQETTYRFRVQLGPKPGAVLEKLADFDLLGACDGAPAARPGATADVIVAPGELARFRALGLRAVLVDRGRPFAEIARATPQGPDANYFTVAEIEAELLALQTKYPALAKRIDLTAYTGAPKTWNGHHIYALVISDRPGVDEGEPAILVAAQHHARELGPPYVAIQLARRILAGYASDALLKAAVDSYEIWIVPCVNPDGVDWVWTRDNYWRKNRRPNGFNYGVDLNRNYPFAWGRCGSSSYTGSQVYRGPSAASEPEVKTMLALAAKRRFERYLDLHSYGREVLSTYSPCIGLYYRGSALASYLDGLRNKLALSLGYRTRSPSASGEAPESHWAQNGTLSFLVEFGTAFQPVFTVTKAEEARIWPGLRAWLAWAPPLRGHLRSLQGNAPLAGTLVDAGFGFRFGEHAASRADGRFALWLPAGTRSVDLQAAGHDPRRVQLAAPGFGTTKTLTLELVPSLPKAVLQGPSIHKMGARTNLVLSTGQPGKPYWIAMSLGTSPGVRIGPRTLPLNPDGLFVASARDLTPLFSGNLGTLDASGRATAVFAFPRIPFFQGFTVYFAGLVIDPRWPYGIQAFSAPLALKFSL